MNSILDLIEYVSSLAQNLETPLEKRDARISLREPTDEGQLPVGFGSQAFLLKF